MKREPGYLHIPMDLFWVGNRIPFELYKVSLEQQTLFTRSFSFYTGK